VAPDARRISDRSEASPPLVARLAAIVGHLTARTEDTPLPAGPTERIRKHPLSWPARSLVVLALAKIGGAAVMLITTPLSPTSAAAAIPVGFVALQLLAFAGAGAALLVAHARDSRTAHLGVVLVLVGSAFATSHFTAFSQAVPAARLLVPLYPDAFLPLFLGRFIQTFPTRRPDSFGARALYVLVRIAGTAGLILFVSNGVLGWNLTAGSLPWLQVLQRHRARDTTYWTAIFGLMLLVLPLSFSGMGELSTDERRRVRWFWTAFLVALGPMVLTIVMSALPRYGPHLSNWATTSWRLSVLELLLASLPVSVTYAVLVRRMLPVRVVLRQAVQYLLARGMVTAAFVIPVGFLLVEGYQHRQETIEAALSGRGLWLVAATAIAGVLLVGREDLRRAIDRWFFREAYDAREVLIGLGEQSRRARRLDELVARLTAGIDRALRPESLAVLVRDEAGGHFVSLFGSVEPLSTSSILADLLAVALEPIEVALEDRDSPLRWLPRDERQWLVDSRSRLIVPLHTSDGQLVGLITLAERKSELPFSREDRRLLLAIADAGALTIENHAMRTTSVAEPGPSTWWRIGLPARHAQATECPACGGVQPGADTACRRCGTTLKPSDVPPVLFGKFRFEERVGQGGMGVVYRATDLALERTVAVKTLPGTSPELSQRLRGEAKAMAAVTHQNLAIIYGAESWRGRPMLICEFMTHGTLATRLAAGPLALSEALTQGIALAEALQVIHAAGLLHRDIKPSNIGYVDRWVPKLLDFGLVHILLTHTASSDPRHPSLSLAASDNATLLSLSLTGPLVGTPLYVSPEAILGRSPTTAFDLWSLNVLLLEAITGRHPFRGRTVKETLGRIREARVTEALTELRQTSKGVTAYFERALARDLGIRPKSAVEVAESLRHLAREN
jgi:hypothetical protein